jgi:Rieske Fe-S protein
MSTEVPAEVPACRRTVLRGAALASVAGVAGAGLTACGGKKSGSSDGPTTATDLGAATEVPVGGAKIFRDDKVVVSQPTQGSFKAFSAVCTHQGCVLDSVDGTTASCPCHGSKFNAETGAVIQGPATRALPAVKVAEASGRLTAG